MKYILVLFLITATAQAKVIQFGDGTEPITITYGGTTLLRFPSDVRTISQAQRFDIQPADPEQPNYSLLAVRPRFTTGVGKVAFILSDGTIVRTKLVVVSGGEGDIGDSIYEFRSKDASPMGDKERLAGDVSSVELMKAMVRGETASGYVSKNVSREITPGFDGVLTKLIRIYSGERFRGYIFEVVNKSKQRLSINIQNLMVGDPNAAILSYADRDVIEPEKGERGKAIVYIVAKPMKDYNQLILPIETVEKR